MVSVWFGTCFSAASASGKPHREVQNEKTWPDLRGGTRDYGKEYYILREGKVVIESTF